MMILKILQNSKASSLTLTYTDICLSFSSILNSPTNKNSTIITSNLYQNYFHDIQQSTPPTLNNSQSKENPRKRCFDVDSLLAPDQPCLIKRQKSNFIYSPNSKSDISS